MFDYYINWIRNNITFYNSSKKAIYWGKPDTTYIHFK